MFNMDDYKLNDTANPPWDETNQGVFADGISKSDTKTEIQPRLSRSIG